MRALILSAGLGERLKPLTLKRAKPAIEFLTVPMLAFPYYWLESLGLTDVVFNTHYLPDTVRHAAMRIAQPEVRMHFPHENEILGSGGGIWNARFDLMKERTFAVANADGVVLSPNLDLLKDMLRFHEGSGAIATLLVCPLEEIGSVRPGVWCRPDGAVRGFGKASPEAGCEGLHYASYMLLSDEIWPLLPEGGSNILYDVLEPHLKKGGRVMAYRANDIRWFETGNVPEYLAATKQVLEFMREGSPLGRCATEIMSRFAQSYSLHSKLDRLQLISDSAQIPNDVSLEGFVVAGENCVVSSGSSLKNCVLLNEAAVNGLHVEDSVII